MKNQTIVFLFFLRKGTLNLVTSSPPNLIEVFVNNVKSWTHNGENLLKIPWIDVQVEEVDFMSLEHVPKKCPQI